MNKVWHREHVLSRGSSVDNRISWHLEHARVCGCRREARRGITQIPADYAANCTHRNRN